VFLPLSAAALFLSLAYQIMTGDVLGSILLLLLGLVAAYLSLAVATARHLDLPEPVTAAAVTGPAPADEAPIVRSPGGGAWPLAAGLAATLALLGFVLGPLASFAAMAVAAVTAVGWLGRVSAERTGRYPNLLPLGIPVLGLFAIASLMFFMSRILLAVPEQGSTWIALAVAVVIMAAGTVFALRPNISGKTMAVVLAVAGVLMLAGGLIAAAVGERTIEHTTEHDSEHGAGFPAVEVAARDIAFDKADLVLRAESDVTLQFVNADTGVPHNLAVYRTEDFTDPVYQGEVVTGEATRTYEFKAPGPGTYHFRCDVHPNMKGTVTVQ